MQQCQVGWDIPLTFFAQGFWGMVPEKWSPQWEGLNPQPFNNKYSAFTTKQAGYLPYKMFFTLGATLCDHWLFGHFAIMLKFIQKLSILYLEWPGDLLSISFSLSQGDEIKQLTN
jgi:hypothetical protein